MLAQIGVPGFSAEALFVFLFVVAAYVISLTCAVTGFFLLIGRSRAVERGARITAMVGVLISFAGIGVFVAASRGDYTLIRMPLGLIWALPAILALTIFLCLLIRDAQRRRN
jgi:hypothetical protein